MIGHWHPVSTVLVPELGGYASPTMVRMMLSAGDLTVRYAGDRMWPAVRHGDELEVVSVVPGEPLPRRTVLLVDVDGIPDVLRLASRDAGGLALVGDADPTAPQKVGEESVLGRVAGVRSVGSRGRLLRRLALELREAWLEDPGAAGESVRAKYDSQAAYYAGTPQRLDPGLARRLVEQRPERGRLLVAGSGAGGECFDLADDGWQVRGIDFSASMVDHARRRAAEIGSQAAFHRADLLRHDEPPGSLQTILFTYDVYSFLPRRRERVELLRRMARWLDGDGAIFLSARMVGARWSRVVLTLQWLGRGAPGLDDWGGSHTRYVDPDGTLRRSFVHYFTRGGLRKEVREAGLEPAEQRAGHLRVLRPSSVREEDGSS